MAGVALLIVLVLLGVAAATAWQMLLRPANPVAAGQPVEFTVKSGQSVGRSEWRSPSLESCETHSCSG